MQWGRILPILALVVATTLPPALVAADGSVDARTLVVGPDGYETIQGAVNAAAPGDTVLVTAGTYQEAVVVTTPGLTLRGESRESVVLDGGGVLDNAFSVTADDVTIESMTAQNYENNGFSFSNVDGFRMFDLHAKDNVYYGLYAIHSTRGEISHSYAEGHGDGGLYIGETPHCDCDVHNNTVWGNALGYSGTANSWVRIHGNTFFENRGGIVMNILPNEMGVERDGTVYGTQVRTEIHNNVLRENNNESTPLAGIAETIAPPVGTGVILAGGWFNHVHDNTFIDNDYAGVVLVWMFFPPRGNMVTDNHFEGGRYGIWWDEWGEDHCFEGNTFSDVRVPSDPDPLPSCTGPLGDVGEAVCPPETRDWLACRFSDARAPHALKEANMFWRVLTKAGAEDDVLPIYE